VHTICGHYLWAGTWVAQADYALEHMVYDINYKSAKLCKMAAMEVEKATGRRRFCAGAIGPTNRTLSISPKVENAAFRNITFMELVGAYKDQVRGLVDGGCDMLFVETIFDTLNAKAALFAIDVFFEEYEVKMPVVISGTIVDMSGRTLSGQTTEAFWISVSHANPLCVGLNCALGPDQMRPFMTRLANCATCYTHAYPNAGLPNAMGGYDMGPKDMAPHLRSWAQDGLVNLVGGCCGTTPDHIKAIADAVADVKPARKIPDQPEYMRLSGLEPMIFTPEVRFANIGERCNVAGSIRFKKMVVANDWGKAAEVAQNQVYTLSSARSFMSVCIYIYLSYIYIYIYISRNSCTVMYVSPRMCIEYISRTVSDASCWCGWCCMRLCCSDRVYKYSKDV